MNKEDTFGVLLRGLPRIFFTFYSFLSVFLPWRTHTPFIFIIDPWMPYPNVQSWLGEWIITEKLSWQKLLYIISLDNLITHWKWSPRLPCLLQIQSESKRPLPWRRLRKSIVKVVFAQRYLWIKLKRLTRVFHGKIFLSLMKSHSMANPIQFQIFTLSVQFESKILFNKIDWNWTIVKIKQF